MNDQPDMRAYDLVLVETRDREKRRAELRGQRSSPWMMGLWASAALVLPCIAWVAAWWWIEPADLLHWAVTLAIGAPLLPITFLVLLGVYDRALFEHTYLVKAKDSLDSAPTAAVSTSGIAPTSAAGLRPGIKQDGEIVSPAPRPDPAKLKLIAACVKLARAGVERGSWTRAAIAEGPDAMMPGDEWDLASPELQRVGYFYNKAGKGGGLRPVEHMPIAEIIKRLEVAL